MPNRNTGIAPSSNSFSEQGPPTDRTRRLASGNPQTTIEAALSTVRQRIISPSIDSIRIYIRHPIDKFIQLFPGVTYYHRNGFNLTYNGNNQLTINEGSIHRVINIKHVDVFGPLKSTLEMQVHSEFKSTKQTIIETATKTLDELCLELFEAPSQSLEVILQDGITATLPKCQGLESFDKTKIAFIYKNFQLPNKDQIELDCRNIVELKNILSPSEQARLSEVMNLRIDYYLSKLQERADRSNDSLKYQHRENDAKMFILMVFIIDYLKDIIDREAKIVRLMRIIQQKKQFYERLISQIEEYIVAQEANLNPGSELKLAYAVQGIISTELDIIKECNAIGFF